MINKFVGIILLVSLAVVNSYSQIPAIEKNLVLSGFTRPVKIVGADNLLFVAEIGGKIKVLENDTLKQQLALDISNNVLVPDWQGIYSFAFHPNYPTQPYIFVLYFNKNDNYQATLSRFTLSIQNNNPTFINEVEVLKIPYNNPNGHLGGDIAFGKDGYLYISTGDNSLGARGSAGDPLNNSQNLQTYYGKLLRIDVNATTYSIPLTNPFLVQNDNIPDEIWANGLRNPWRFSFDRESGELWIGDNGQDGWEEVDVVNPTISAGSNFGWRCYEGNAVYDMNGCSGSNFVSPLHVFAGFDNNGGSPASVIGGYVYRGAAYPALRGWYIYGDYGNGNVYLMKKNVDNTYQHSASVFNATGIVSFGENTAGEIYFCTFYSGELYRISAKDCQQNIPISSKIQGNYTLKASETITFSNEIDVNSNVDSRAGKFILLTPNFQVKQGSVFKASIEGCN